MDLYYRIHTPTLRHLVWQFNWWVLNNECRAATMLEF